MSVLVIDGYEYESERDVLIAVRYSDGVMLRFTGVHSGLETPITAEFVRVGPRGGVQVLAMRWKHGSMIEWTNRIRDALAHFAVIEQWRRRKWGS